MTRAVVYGVKGEGGVRSSCGRYLYIQQVHKPWLDKTQSPPIVSFASYTQNGEGCGNVRCTCTSRGLTEHNLLVDIGVLDCALYGGTCACFVGNGMGCSVLFNSDATAVCCRAVFAFTGSKYVYKISY